MGVGIYVKGTPSHLRYINCEKRLSDLALLHFHYWHLQLWITIPIETPLQSVADYTIVTNTNDSKLHKLHDHISHNDRTTRHEYPATTLVSC